MDAGRYAMRVRISPSWTAGRTCSETAPIVPTRVRAPSPSLLRLFAVVRRLVSRWLQSNAPPPWPAPSTPDSETQEGRARNYNSRHASLSLSAGRERGHSMAEPVTSLDLGDCKRGAERHKGLWASNLLPGAVSGPS